MQGESRAICNSHNTYITKPLAATIDMWTNTKQLTTIAGNVENTKNRRDIHNEQVVVEKLDCYRNVE